jgi:hypothetical protein
MPCVSVCSGLCSNMCFRIAVRCVFGQPEVGMNLRRPRVRLLLGTQNPFLTALTPGIGRVYCPLPDIQRHVGHELFGPVDTRSVTKSSASAARNLQHPAAVQEAVRRLQAGRREASAGRVSADLSARLAEAETETTAALAKAERENGGVYLQVDSTVGSRRRKVFAVLRRCSDCKCHPMQTV